MKRREFLKSVSGAAAAGALIYTGVSVARGQCSCGSAQYNKEDPLCKICEENPLAQRGTSIKTNGHTKSYPDGEDIPEGIKRQVVERMRKVREIIRYNAIKNAG